VKGILIRVGIDQAFGRWNAPADPETGDFAYVPIPDAAQRSGLETPYSSLRPALSKFPKATLPLALAGKAMHLDPDFEHLTYGDNGLRRGRGLGELQRGDFAVFFAGLRPMGVWPDPLLYALIGFYRVQELVRLGEVPRERWIENAHTRRAEHRATDVIVRAERGFSGRLRHFLVVGEWRDRAYRVRRDLLKTWGGLSCRDGYIQRSAVPPTFLDAERFVRWFEGQAPELVAMNNP
jgi:putative DNA base modification enzyme with NMAD domain